MGKLAGLILGAACFGFAGAGLAQNAPVAGDSARFRVFCNASPVCDDPAAPAFDEARAHGTKIAQTLEAIQDWFDEMRYPPTYLQRQDGRTIASYANDNACGEDTNACVSRPFSTPEMMFPRARMMQASANTGTIAHEYAHTLHKIRPAQPVRWLDEAIGRAIAQEWNGRAGKPFNVAAAEFDLALDVPFNTPPQEGNAQGDYLQFVGDQLGVPPKLGYLRDFFMLPNDGYGGMTYLYRSALGSGVFDVAFPKYVARFNSLDTFDEGDGRFYSAPDIVKTNVGPPDMIGKISRDRTAKAYAADAVHFSAVTIDEPKSGEDRDALMVVEIKLTDAERPADLRLIYEHRQILGHSHKFLVRAGAAMDLGFVRVTNAATTAEATKNQGYTVNLELQPVELQLPSCVETGASTKIEVRDGVLDGVDNYRIVPSTGSVDGFSFTAPSSPQTVSLSLRIKSTITRPNTGIAPKARPDRVVDLGEVTVAKSCMIQMMKLGGIKATYDALNDYTAYETGDGNAMYARPGEIAMYDGRKGKWVDIPPMMQSMMGGKMQSVGPIGNIVGTIKGAKGIDPNILARMPKIFSQRFSWAIVSGVAKKARPNDPVSSPAACPAGSGATKCRAILHDSEGAIHPITYDSEHKLVGINLDGQVMVFRYGTFNIARPPGW